jgi:curved DNA-binding protein CbpA
MNLYAILGVPSDADEQMIRSAYRILARRYHPDRGVGSSIEKFRQVAEAYDTLIHPGRREAYDSLLLRAERPTSIRAEPMVPPREPFRQRSPAVFGHFERPPYGPTFRAYSRVDELFDECIRSIESDLFFGTVWRW